MQSEVRKVLESMRGNGWAYWFWNEIDAAERADAARSEEPVRKAVAELIDKWRTCFLPTPVAEIVRDLLTELNAIISTKTDSQPADASGPVRVDWPPSWVTAQQWKEKQAGASPKVTLPAGTPADERIRAIAAQAVRDAMPDVMDGLAETFGEAGFSAVTNAFREHAVKLRKDRGA